MLLKIDNLPLAAAAAPADADRRLTPVIARFLHCRSAAVSEYHILSRSIDARSSSPVILYTLAVEAAVERLPRGASPMTGEELAERLNPHLEIPPRPEKLLRPLVIGTGPAGIFAALVLAEAGCRPVILDRGFDVDRRCADREKFLRTRELDPESNLLIGEGGAGTFSDGKLYTRVRDPRSGFVLKTFVEAGAPEEIRYLKRPHIGSDNLVTVARNLRKRIEGLGGEFRFGCRVEDILLENGRCAGVRLHSGESIAAPAVIMAHGLGGRELTLKLIEHGLEHRLKGFQIGCRVEHPQLLIDGRMYHMPSRPAALGAAEYNFVSRPDDPAVPGVSTFCMCPGGSIVMASAWPGRLTTNGMSCHARAGKFANSCLIMTLPPERFIDARHAYDFLERLERTAFEAGGGDYTVPAQSAAGFCRGLVELNGDGENSVDTGIRPARLDKLLEPEMKRAIRTALRAFDKRCAGFIGQGTVTAIESCVSSPVAFERNEETGESSLPGLYLAGEGAGRAGGIISAALDGLEAALKLLGRGA